MPSLAIRIRSKEILLETAKKYDVPAASIVAHVITPVGVNKARKEVQLRMLQELGMKRHEIASAFGRDLRRVRQSVIGPFPTEQTFQ